MTETLTAVVTRGFSPLGLSVGYALKREFGVFFFDRFNSEMRNKVTQDGLSFSLLNTESEAGVLHSLQHVINSFGNVRVLVNIIEPKDIIEDSAFKDLSSSVVKEKVSTYLESTMALIKVVACQMATQTEVEGSKGLIVNVIDCSSDADSSLLSSMICGAITSITAPLANMLMPYHIRVNAIVIDPREKVCEVTQPNFTQTVTVTTSEGVLSVLQSIIEEPSSNAVNFTLRSPEVRL
jgi:NAD(P)-dependent dehydrogenase (short-subunit alcohol dehydrogenase family)